MALNWDNIEIISEEEDVVTTADFDIINVEGSERMIITSGERGDQGPAGTITIGTTTTLPAGSDATVVNRGTPEEAIIDFGIPMGADGTTDYNDLTNKPTLGTMSAVNDAPSDGNEYVRKNGDWKVASGGGGGSSAWGGITGDIDDQTDLKNALDAKADSADLGALASKDTVDWTTDITNKPASFPPSTHTHDDRYYTEGEIDTALSGKSNTGHTHTMSDVTDLPTLGALAEKDTVDWDTDIDDIPSTFPPSSHTHTTSDISNFPTLGSLAAKSSVDYSTSEVTNKPTLGTMSAVNDASSDGKLYGRKNGAWSEVPTPSAPEWGDVGGTLSDQTDLANALAAKADSADLGDLAGMDSIDYTSAYLTNKPPLGTMSSVNDAPSDGKDYARKNGGWSEVTGGGGGGSAEWGDITGTLSDQTDLNTALSAKANDAIVANAFSTSTAYDIGDLVIYQGNLYKFTSAHSAGPWNASHVSAVIVADGFMKKTGDTMTGAFGIKNPNMSRSAASQSELITSELWFLDANDEYLAWNQCGQETTGKIFFSFGAGRYKQNTTTFVSTNVGLFVAKDGTKQVKFTGGNDKDIWLDALGLSDSGWKSYTNSTKFSGTIYYRKIGNVLYFSSGSYINLVTNCTEYENLGTIPSGYRPSKDVVLNCYINTEVAVRPLGLRINTSGIIYIYANSGQTITPQHSIYLSGCGI